MPKTTGNFKFLLVLADIFSGWVEAHPTRMEKASEVTIILKRLFQDMGPHLQFRVIMGILS
jgi:hypothetical protein